jgi:hopanoid biosynthesis associated RND transporter like protein HpnN
MRDRLLQSYAAWVVRNARWIVVSALVIAALSITVSVLFLKTKTGILDLYSKKEPFAKRFMDYVDQFGAAETLIVVFEGKDESERRRAMEALAERLRKDPQRYINDLFYKIDLTLFKEHVFQFLKEEEAEKLLEEIRQPKGGVRMFFQAQDFNDYLKFLNRSIEEGLKRPKMPQDKGLESFSQALEPLFLFNDFLSGEDLKPDAMTTRLQGHTQDRSTIDDLGYLRTNDRSMHIMLVRPDDRRQDYKVANKLVKYVREQIDELKGFPSVTIGVTGGPALNNDQFEISKRDMTLASIFAFFSTGVIFILAFKSFGRPFLGLLTLALAITTTFGMTTLTVGHLNLFSLAFIVILVGQGTYYGVHVVSRYEEELLKGKEVSQAIQETIRCTFGNITASTVTTAVAFFATMVVPLKGFAELGWIAGMGILLSSLGMQSVLPALLFLYDRNRPRSNLQQIHRSFFGNRLKASWLSFSDTAIKRCAPYLIVLVLAAAAWGAYLFFSPAHGIPFDSNLLNLQAKDTEAVTYEKKLIETSLSPRAGIFLADSFEAAQDMATRAKSLGTVQRVEWVGDVFPEGTIKLETHRSLQQAVAGLFPTPLRAPDLDQMAENLARLRGNLEKIGELAINFPQGELFLEKTEAALSTIQEISDKIPAFDKGLDEESKQLLAEQFVLPQVNEFQNRFFPAVRGIFTASAQAERVDLTSLPPEILNRFVSGEKTYAVYAFPSVNIWEREPLEKFVSELRSVDADVTGPPIMFYEILSLVRNSYFKAAGLAALAIFLVFLVDFKSLRYSILAFLPLILGVFSLFGLMSTFNLSFNTANMIALPMILGIGADNGVHIIHRFREERGSNIDFLFRSTGKALLITYLDTITSFVGLAFANHRGLAQLGRVVILGVTCCTAAGILFLPSIMVLMIKRRVKKNSTK